jgi:hypothetical protein
MLVLQSSRDPLKFLPGSSSESLSKSSDGACNFSNMEVEEDISIKQKEVPEDKSFPDIRSEPDDVSYVCVCLLLDTFYHCPKM